MFAVFPTLRKALRPAVAALAALALSACEPVAIGGGGAGAGGPQIDPGAAIPVALLVPRSDPNAAAIAVSLENAARMAIAANPDARIDLRVYDTAGNTQTAAVQAQKAVDEGARIILGPLYGESANAAGLAVADEGVNVLSFSNNASIAGGNVFVLGPTFANTADRLMGFSRRQGRQSVVVVYSDDVPGQFGRIAIEQAAARNGVRIVAAQGYPLSVEGVNAAAQAAGQAAGAGADSVFITTDATNAALPMLLQTLPENGASPAQVQYIGLTRWDVRPDLFSQPGAQGAWFAIPDQDQQRAFEARYRAAYGAAPHPLAGLAHDGITAIAALAAEGRRDALTGRALTRGNGFNGTGGTFRLTSDGSNQRALAVAAIRNQQMVILDPAPSSLGGAGF